MSISLFRNKNSGLWSDEASWNDNYGPMPDKYIDVECNTGTVAVYGPRTPVFTGYGTVNIVNSIAVNALTTGASATIGFVVHKQHIQPVIITAFVAAFGTYVLVALFFYIMIGFGGASISSTHSIVLDKKTSIAFAHATSLPVVGVGGFICLQLDNSLLLPVQKLHSISYILGFAKVLNK